MTCWLATPLNGVVPFARAWKGCPMFQWIKQGSRQRQVAHEIYGSIVSQAREPGFYRTFGVADTVSGRFELICLHLFGVLESLGAAGAGESLGRAVVERFFVDMDDVMREMGVGDTTVPKRMRTASEGLYGRLDAYARGIRSEDPAVLRNALARNVYGVSEDGTLADEAALQATALAGYVHVMIAHLDALPDADITGAGQISFPALD